MITRIKVTDIIKIKTYLTTTVFDFLFKYVPILDPMIAPNPTATPFKISNFTNRTFPINPAIEFIKIAPKEVPTANLIGRSQKNINAGTNKYPPPMPSKPAEKPATIPTGINLYNSVSLRLSFFLSNFPLSSKSVREAIKTKR